MRAVVFDMDDTLFPEAAFVRGGLRAAGAWLEAQTGLPPGRAVAVFLEVLEADGPFRVFDLGLERLGLDRTPDLVQDLVRTYRDHPPVLVPHPGIPALLDALRARDVRLALATDGYEDVQRRKWAALGLQDRFDVATFTASVDGVCCPKPDRRAFRSIEAALGLQGAGPEVVVVGDQPAKDFPPAEALGWATVRMMWPGAWHAGDPDPDPRRRVARSAAELAVLLGCAVT